MMNNPKSSIADKLIRNSNARSDRVLSSKEDREAAKLSEGNIDLEALTIQLYGQDL